MPKDDPDGVLDIEYAQDRRNKRSVRYRLGRRTREVCRAIDSYAQRQVNDILDLGTAEGRMLHLIHEKFPKAHCVGVEFSKELAALGEHLFSDIEIVRGDVTALDMPDDSFDVVTAAAVIEHVPDPMKLVCEAARVLHPEGIFIVTCPDPFWESVATRVGHLRAEQHHWVANLDELTEMAQQCGLKVLEADKFMISPVGIPFELTIESIRKVSPQGKS